MKYVVYILKSEHDGNYYVGMTKDILKRLKTHNSGGVRSTKFRRPLKLVYKETYDSAYLAREREKYLKSYQGSREKMAILDKIK